MTLHTWNFAILSSILLRSSRTSFWRWFTYLFFMCNKFLLAFFSGIKLRFSIRSCQISVRGVISLGRVCRIICAGLTVTRILYTGFNTKRYRSHYGFWEMARNKPINYYWFSSIDESLESEAGEKTIPILSFTSEIQGFWRHLKTIYYYWNARG